VQRDLAWVQILLRGSLHAQSGFMSKGRGSLSLPLAWTICTAVGKISHSCGRHACRMTRPSMTSPRIHSTSWTPSPPERLTRQEVGANLRSGCAGLRRAEGGPITPRWRKRVGSMIAPWGGGDLLGLGTKGNTRDFGCNLLVCKPRSMMPTRTMAHTCSRSRHNWPCLPASLWCTGPGSCRR
jgi:hypothetical protein